MAEKQYKYNINMDCSHCAEVMEEKFSQFEEIKFVSISHVTKKLVFTLNNNANLDNTINKMRILAEDIEPGTKIEAIDSIEDHYHHHHATFKSYDLVLGLILFLALSFINFIPQSLEVYLYIFTYLVLGHKIIRTAIKNLFKGQPFDENFLMTIATLGAFMIGEHLEAIGVMLFYRLGEAFEVYATNKSKNDIIQTIDLRPDIIHKVVDNNIVDIKAEDIKINDIVKVLPGERIGVDGIVINGESSLDTSAITGEARPQKIQNGSEILSGSINLSSPIYIKVTTSFEDSLVSRILEAVENANNLKPKMQRFITRFAKIYSPIVVLIAVVTAFIPPIFLGDFTYWLYTALTFLVISCPCALVLSVPLSFFAGIGKASKYGILFKGGITLEALLKIKTIAFDKTGTLTKGNFIVKEILPHKNISEEKLLLLCASMEKNSTHPIAKSILNKAKDMTLLDVVDSREISGEGIVARIGEDLFLCGNKKLMNRYNIVINENLVFADTTIYLATDKKYLGCMLIGDQIKEDSKKVIDFLHKKGIHTAIFTGDNEKTAKNVGDILGIKEVFANLLPQDKLDKLIKLREEKGAIMFVGDGINDAPILSGADVSCAMASGSDIAIETSDIVFLNSNILEVKNALKIAKDTMKIAWQNVFFAIAIKVLIMILGLMGFASMWAAVFADSGVTLICVLNALRIFYKSYEK